MNQEILKAKQEVVSEVVDNIKNSNAVVVVEYRGLNVAEITEMRRALREVGGTMRVYKNTLVERAVNELGLTGLDDALAGPNAIVFTKDTIAGPKVIAKFAKKHECLVVKGGVIEGKVASVNDVATIAALPGRDGLISMFLSCLQAPVRGFACAVKAIADKQN